MTKYLKPRRQAAKYLGVNVRIRGVGGNKAMIARHKNPPDRQRRYDLRNCELIVLNPKELSPQPEMVEDIRAILKTDRIRI
ncbi:hypothetical protein WN50_05200 [Limnoraphis robusta CS-951]|uniref:Uncharacterized protein n=1 Tax=Limnoraphis robusta CS-951 TaxID=1637645 RepID=A0A0F5YLS3_9CYAN|nr:hypothetical protein WN50_05200 [Limnoraphis robusta CS-951]